MLGFIFSSILKDSLLSVLTNITAYILLSVTIALFLSFNKQERDSLLKGFKIT
jgi:hypothetical protein